MAKINSNNKNIVDVAAEIKRLGTVNLGIDEVEFPDGTKEKFYFNGEADRQAAINFATICYNATNDTAKCKQMMFTCFMLLSNGITPTEIVTLNNGATAYIDHERRLIADGSGNIITELADDEKEAIGDNLIITRLLVERANATLRNNHIDDYYDDDYDDCDEYDECNW